MVVLPTSPDVRLTYGVTRTEWLGRFLTLIGVVLLGWLVWRFRARPQFTATWRSTEDDES